MRFKIRQSTINIIIIEWKYRVFIVKLEIGEPSITKTMQRICMRIGKWQNKIIGILSRKTKTEFQKSPLDGVTQVY